MAVVLFCISLYNSYQLSCLRKSEVYLYVDHLPAVEVPAEQDPLHAEGHRRAQVVQVLRQQPGTKNKNLNLWQPPALTIRNLNLQ